MGSLQCLEKKQYETAGQSSIDKYESGIQIITSPSDHMIFRRTLKLVPMDLFVGIGCKRGKTSWADKKSGKQYM